METISDKLLDEASNFYAEYNQQGLNPKPFSLDDVDIRRRGKEFLNRQEVRNRLRDEFQATRSKYQKRAENE